MVESLYRSRKPALIEIGMYDFLLGKETYGRFQTKLFDLAKSANSVDLAVACMVEANVAGTIICNSDLVIKSHLLEALTNFPIHIFATAVSEPGWGGSLKNILSYVKENCLFGEKSFITNGEDADSILWITKNEKEFPVYRVASNDVLKYGKVQLIPTNFITDVKHIRVQLEGFPLNSKELVISNYGKFGLEIRLKELYSLVTILLAYTSKLHDQNDNLGFEWKKLFNFWKDTNDTLESFYVKDILKQFFPFPVEGLLNAIANLYGCKSIKDLVTIDPNYQLFIWEDRLTEYLKRT